MLSSVLQNRVKSAAFGALNVFAVGIASPLAAADDNGNFAIEGGGLQTCADFLAAGDSPSPDLAAYGGWVEGYLTGLNQHTDGVFDLTPWQTTPSLMSLVRSVCEQLPEDTLFIGAVTQLVRLLLPMALTEASEAQAITSGGQGTVIYKAVIARLQERLTELGYDPGPVTGDYDPRTELAVRAFQSDTNVEVTGLPDQSLLFELLMRQTD